MTDTLARQFPLREELIDGKLFAMSPSPAWNHVSVSGNIYHLFKTYLKGRKCMPIPDGCAFDQGQRLYSGCYDRL